MKRSTLPAMGILFVFGLGLLLLGCSYKTGKPTPGLSDPVIPRNWSITNTPPPIR